MAPTYSIVVPTLNAGSDAEALTTAIRAQRLLPERVQIIDSQSTDGTASVFRAAGFHVDEIPRDEFDAGGTRTRGLSAVPDTSEFVVYLSQDAHPSDPSAISNLLSAFEDRRIAAAYGRQLPRAGASPIEAFARLHNYPQTSHVRCIEDVAEIGFETCFFSNSFAAYRVRELREVGGFRQRVIFGEDALTVAELLRQGHRIAYAADAQAVHSHRYNLRSEFRRHFDIGAMHARSDVLTQFGRPHGKGFRYVRNEMAYLARIAPQRLPEAAVRTAIKFTAYTIGRRERMLPLALKRRLSLNSRFWRDQPVLMR